jgi:transposase
VTRAEKVAEAQRLRHEGFYYREIGERLGVSVSTADQYVNDPDLLKLRARKDSYRGKCEKCGGPTDGSNGPGGAPKRCNDCQSNRFAKRNDLLREMWEADEPTWYIAERLGMSETAITAWVDHQRRRNGRKLTLRKLGGNQQTREARHRRMLALRRQGKTNAEIAEAVGMASPDVVSNAFAFMRRKGLDVPPSGPGRGRTSLMPDEEFIQLWQADTPAKEIAERAGYANARSVYDRVSRLRKRGVLS